LGKATTEPLEPSRVMGLVALQVALQGIDIVVHSPARAIGEPRDGHHRLSPCQKVGERSQLTWQHAHSFRQVNAAIDRGTLGTGLHPQADGRSWRATGTRRRDAPSW
jgi:hypothetical protein